MDLAKRNNFFGNQHPSISRSVKEKLRNKKTNGTLLHDVQINLKSLYKMYDRATQQSNLKIDKLNTELKRLQGDCVQMTNALQKYQQYAKALEDEYQKQQQIQQFEEYYHKL